MPFDPISLGAGGLQFLTGLGQSIFSGRKKAEKALNKQIDSAPKVTANKSIMDFYNTALARYGVSPTDSALYKQQSKNIGRNVATGIGALQDRRSGLGGVSSILRAANDANLNANVAAEQQRNQRFGQLGQAAGMQSQEEKYVFNQNQMLPFELKTNMAAQKLQGANQRTNAGMQNIFGGFNTIASGFSQGENNSQNNISQPMSSGRGNSFSSLQGGLTPNYSLAGSTVGMPYNNTAIPGLSNFLKRPR
jgi:hypothetical protein